MTIKQSLLVGIVAAILFFIVGQLTRNMDFYLGLLTIVVAGVTVGLKARQIGKIIK